MYSPFSPWIVEHAGLTWITHDCCKPPTCDVFRTLISSWRFLSIGRNPHLNGQLWPSSSMTSQQPILEDLPRRIVSGHYFISCHLKESAFELAPTSGKDGEIKLFCMARYEVAAALIHLCRSWTWSELQLHVPWVGQYWLRMRSTDTGLIVNRRTAYLQGKGSVQRCTISRTLFSHLRICPHPPPWFVQI